jgi:type III secretory pathway component EscV
MKKIIQKASKFESKKSLDGAMKFLKGNVSKPAKGKLLPMKKK